MKIKSTFKVVLESDDGNAEFTFKKPQVNSFLDRQIEDASKLGADGLKRLFSSTLNDLVDLKGLCHDDGREVTKEEVTSLKLDIDTCLAIIAGYNAALGKKADNEKKDS